MRTKKAMLNFIYDALPQILISLIGFIRIKVILDILGNDTLGIYQLFGQLLAYVSLADLGLTTAVIYSLYEPIFHKDHKRINAILSGTKKVFNYIFIIMLIIGTVLTFNITVFIKETTLNVTFIKLCFFIMMISSILPYVIVPYASLFDSEQNKYRYLKYTQILSIIRVVLEVVFVLLFKSLLFILIMSIAFVSLQNIIIIYLCKKDHKWLSLNEEKDYSFVKKTKALIPHRIGVLIANNIDVVIISTVLGLTEVVAYTSYMYIVNTLTMIISKINPSTQSGIGNLIVENKGKKNKKVFETFIEYNAFVFFLATLVCVPLYSVMSQFVGLVYGSKYVLDTITVLLFIFLVFYSIIRNNLNIYTNAAGLFKETIICVILEIVINLSLSLVLVHYIGITGVLLATTIAYIVSEYLIKPFILNKHVFNDNIGKYYKDSFIYVIYIVLFGFLFSKLTSLIYIKNIFIWFAWGVLITLINFIFAFIYYYFILKKRDFIDRTIYIIKGKKNEI